MLHNSYWKLHSEKTRGKLLQTKPYKGIECRILSINVKMRQRAHAAADKAAGS